MGQLLQIETTDENLGGDDTIVAGDGDDVVLGGSGADAILATYEIERDDAALRANTERFEQLRGDYPVRREFDSFSIRAVGVRRETLRKLSALAFRCPEAADSGG